MAKLDRIVDELGECYAEALGTVATAKRIVDALCDASAVERIAKKLYFEDHTRFSAASTWKDAPDVQQDLYRDNARAILNLLIEE